MTIFDFEKLCQFHDKCSLISFDVFKSDFRQLLQDNKPNEAQKLIDENIN